MLTNEAEWAAAPLFGQSGGGVQWWISVLGQEDNVMKKKTYLFARWLTYWIVRKKKKMQYLMGKSHCGIQNKYKKSSFLK